jgi:hypothetical protein
MCPYCGQLAELPSDYTATIGLRSEIKSLLRSATLHWRIANVITHPFSTSLFVFLIFFEALVLLPVTLIGSNMYEDTWADKFFESLGESATFVMMLLSLLGLVLWMVVFIILSQLGKNLRRKLPVVPVFDETLTGSETAPCQTCGGRIEYDKGAFASICSYCNVENFRAQFARRERSTVEGQKSETKSVLFGAMTVIEDFVGTFFVVTLILGLACVLLVAAQALSN